MLVFSSVIKWFLDKCLSILLMLIVYSYTLVIFKSSSFTHFFISLFHFNKRFSQINLYIKISNQFINNFDVIWWFIYISSIIHLYASFLLLVGILKSGFSFHDKGRDIGSKQEIHILPAVVSSSLFFITKVEISVPNTRFIFCLQRYLEVHVFIIIPNIFLIILFRGVICRYFTIYLLECRIILKTSIFFLFHVSVTFNKY